MLTASAPSLNAPRHKSAPPTVPLCFSLGIMAWNEEATIVQTLTSLFAQSVFAALAARGERCEIMCLANGCTDGTVAVTREYFQLMARTHRYAAAFTARVVDIPEPGRNNAWNRFVHADSARETRFIYLMDADIIFRQADTILNLFTTLEQNLRADVASGRQHKDIEFKAHKTLRDRISLATSDLTGTIEGRFTGQLYCLRASIARRLFLPRDLGAVDDGFFKAAICTEFFEHEPDGRRIAQAPRAAHVYQAYVAPAEVLNNQKRQMIGQTTVHVLVEYLKTLPTEERSDLAVLLRRLDEEDPDWLKRRVDRHIASIRFFWQLFPGLLTFRFKRLARLKGIRRLTHLPATLAGFAVTMLACARAHRFLKGGSTYYWPKAERLPRFTSASGAVD